MRQKLALGLFLLISWAMAQEAQAAMLIADDRGGLIGDYVRKYSALQSSGEAVIIDGMCASACTLVVAAVPANRICVTPRARLGFHQAWDIGQAKSGTRVMVPNRATSAILFKVYPAHIQRWITKHGGLPAPNKIIWLRGKALTQMYSLCAAGAKTQF